MQQKKYIIGDSETNIVQIVRKFHRRQFLALQRRPTSAVSVDPLIYIEFQSQQIRPTGFHCPSLKPHQTKKRILPWRQSLLAGLCVTEEGSWRFLSSQIVQFVGKPEPSQQNPHSYDRISSRPAGCQLQILRQPRSRKNLRNFTM
jgi:hypothetical protein